MGFWPLRVLAALTVLLGTFAATGAPASAEPPEQEVDRPNIVLITTDDQSLSDLRHMPFTRQLVGGAGVTFDDAVSPYPLCCPARATILTGQHAHNHGVLANRPPAGGWEALRGKADTLLPVWLQRAGYRTTFAGKFLNTYGRVDETEVPPGWDEWHAVVRGVYRYEHAWVNENGRLVDHTGEYQTDITQDVTETAIRDSAATGQPFFVWQSNLAPHTACEPTPTGCHWGPPEPTEQDEGSLVDAPFRAGEAPGFNERVVVEKPERIRSRAALDRDQVAGLRAKDQARIESLQAVDRNVRDTVELLRSQGMLDKTLLVFASDNGYALGENRWQGKTLGYEPILKVPLLMRGPGVPAGSRVDETVGLVDLGKTFAEAAGARPMIEQDGVSLVDVARGRERGYEAMGIEAGPALPGVPPDDYTYRGVRTRRYTFMRHPVTGEVELYDRKVDPGQLVNVAYRPTHAATRRALESKLARLENCAGRACHGVSGEVPAPEPDRGPVHPDELAASAGTRQLVTVTAPRAGATRGTAVAWQRTGRQWRVARGPMAVGLGGRGMSTTRGGGRDAVTAGVEEPSFAFGRRGAPAGELPYRGIDETEQAPGATTRPEKTYPVLDFLSSSTAVWTPAVGGVLAREPERFEHTVVLQRDRSPEELWSPQLSDWLSGVPASVDRESLLMHTGERFRDRGWLALDASDLDFVLRWAAPQRFHTKVVVGTPAYLRERL